MSQFSATPEYKFAFNNQVLFQLEMQARRRLYAKRPDIWAKDVLGVTLWSKQIEVALSIVENKNTMVAAGHGVGKDLPLTTPIPTPSGWSTIGELQPGDWVYDENGKPCRVVAKSQVFNLPLLETTFSDGAKIKSSASHEWSTIDARAAKRERRSPGGVADWRDHWGASEVRETGEIASTVHYKNGANEKASNHIIPIARALEGVEMDLPIDPYVTGAWLGDGTSIRAEMTIGSDGLYIVDEFAKSGYSLTKTAKGEYRYTFARQGFVDKIRGINLMNNKHIPSDYQRASVQQRKDLLRGLMDTDGFHCHDTTCGIDLMNEELAYDVVELIRGLGTRATITPSRTYLNGRDVGTRYRIVFNPIWSPFTSGQYKDAAWKRAGGSSFVSQSRRTMRTIVSVEPVESVPTQCIQVDSESNLYLATEDLIPTHNSFLTAVLACWWIDTHAIGEARVLSTAPTTAQVRGIVWREMQKLHRESRKRHDEYNRRINAGESTEGYPDHRLPGYITSSATWKSDDNLELGSGRTPPRGREGDAFQGIHGGVFAIADEAVGVSKDMIDTLRNNTTANDDRVLMIANPTNPGSEMGQIWNDPEKASQWSRITISVLESPHFTDEGKGMPESVMKYMTDHDYVEQKKADYGEDSANYQARVLGKWALDSGMILFQEETLQRGIDTMVVPDEDDEIIVGFDVSRSPKGDYSYLYTAQEGWVYETQEYRASPDDPDDFNWHDLPEPVKTDRRGIKLRYLDRWRGLPFHPIRNMNGDRQDEQAANERVHAHMLELGATVLRIDADGMGLLMADDMHDVMRGEYVMTRVKGNDPSPDRNGWYNQRAYQYSELSRRMSLGEVDIEEDKPEAPLRKQLEGIEYKFAAGYAESMLILSKKEMALKGLKSPDAADAAYMCFARILDEENHIGEAFEVDFNGFVQEFDHFYGGSDGFSQGW